MTNCILVSYLAACNCNILKTKHSHNMRSAFAYIYIAPPPKKKDQQAGGDQRMQQSEAERMGKDFDTRRLEMRDRRLVAFIDRAAKELNSRDRAKRFMTVSPAVVRVSVKTCGRPHGHLYNLLVYRGPWSPRTVVLVDSVAITNDSFELPARTDSVVDCNFIQRMLYFNCYTDLLLLFGICIFYLIILLLRKAAFYELVNKPICYVMLCRGYMCYQNYFKIILKLFQCFISRVTTSETEIKLFRPLKEF